MVVGLTSFVYLAVLLSRIEFLQLSILSIESINQ